MNVQIVGSRPLEDAKNMKVMPTRLVQRLCGVMTREMKVIGCQVASKLKQPSFNTAYRKPQMIQRQIVSA